MKIVFILLSITFAAHLHANPLTEDLRQGGWFIGAQAYTFKNFTAFEAIAKTKESGGTIIEFYPGQPLKPGSEIKVHHTMTEEARHELLAECKRVGIKPVAYGVVNAKDAAEVDQIMDFSKKMGLYAVNTEAATLINAWEAAAIRTDVKVAFHQHGGSMSRPDYKVWHPLYISGLVEGRDKRLGACADLGHWATSNLNPVECLRILNGRVISTHIKDKNKTGEAAVVALGQGVVDVAACLEELKKQNFDGPAIIEHENHWNNNVPEVSAGVEFIKKHAK